MSKESMRQAFSFEFKKAAMQKTNKQRHSINAPRPFESNNN